MRYTPLALALSLAFALVGSAGSARVADPQDPRATILLNAGRSALDRGDVDSATDNFEAALAVEPGYVRTLIALGDAARKAGLQGKAIHYYRVALQRDPDNLAAIGGEGSALAEKGAIDRAKGDLARLQGLCGKTCVEAETLGQVIAKGPIAKVASAGDDKLEDPAAEASSTAN